METLNRLEFKVAGQVQEPMLEGTELNHDPRNNTASSPAETSTDGVSSYDENDWNRTDASEQWSPNDVDGVQEESENI